MSGTTAKAARRDLRRTLGTSGLSVVTSTSDFLTKQLVPAVNQQQEDLNGVSARLMTVQQTLTADIQTLQAHVVLQVSSFWQRVRWLVTGS